MEEEVIMPLPFKRLDKDYREMIDYITKASKAVSKLCWIDVPADILINSGMRDEDVPGVVKEEPFWRNPGKITIKPKIDWLAINREMHDGSY